MNKARTVALIAGFGFYVLSLILQGLIPAVLPESESVVVSRTVLTDTGLFAQQDAVAERRSELQAKGRRIYIAEGCWYCHSQYIRPVTGEDLRWGPVSEAGEYAYDQPHELSTRRIGPDLLREGGRLGDDWHIAHFLLPRTVVPGTIMPTYSYLIDKDAIEDGKTGDDVLTDEGRAVVAYIQSLGKSRGRWYDSFLREQSAAIDRISSDKDSVRRGEDVYLYRCAGCHGERGNGAGPAARPMATKPRDFVPGIYKFKSTPKGQPPTDNDLYRTVTLGLPGTAMPGFYSVADEDRADVIAYIKTFAPQMFSKPPTGAIDMGALSRQDPGGSRAIMQRGAQVYASKGCVPCHGPTGKGDGPVASGLRDFWGNPIRPTNFTRGVFKSGPSVVDVMRTVTVGVDGTPMPSWQSLLTEDERWAVSYYVWTRSADDTAEMERVLAALGNKNQGFWCRVITAWQGQPIDTNKPQRFK